VATVLLDLFIPTLVIIGLMIISLLIRREHISALAANPWMKDFEVKIK
jgi:Flp pilus assembly protein protease CpaA